MRDVADFLLALADLSLRGLQAVFALRLFGGLGLDGGQLAWRLSGLRECRAGHAKTCGQSAQGKQEFVLRLHHFSSVELVFKGGDGHHFNGAAVFQVGIDARRLHGFDGLCV